MPPGTGKLCDDNTPVLTTNGWKNHGDLKIGDIVFTESGKQTKVINVSKKGFTNRKITFTDGTTINVHHNHEWKVWDRTSNKWIVKETEKLFNSKLYYIKGQNNRIRYRFGVSRFIKHDMIYIKSIEECDPTPGKCIQVDSPDGIYLVTKQLIPTHNSELVSRRLPAWIFGHQPDARIMATSYGASLAHDMSRDVQKIMVSDEYKKVFPNTKLNEHGAHLADHSRKTVESFEIVKSKGYYKCAGVGGAITGKRFFWGIIDDPVKGHEEAESPVIRERNWQWYNKDFYTRAANKDARILMTLTRWNADDIAGRALKLMELYPDMPELQWTVVRFPMIAEDPLGPGDPRKIGESLWPEFFGDAQVLKATEISEGPYAWSALYQQRPTSPGGTIIHREWWDNHFYDLDPHEIARNSEQVIQSWDCAFKDANTNDFVVGQIWAKSGPHRYLLEEKRSHINFPATMDAIREMTTNWPESITKLIEDKANGTGIISILRNEIPGILAVEPYGGKIVRAHSVTGFIKAGNVWLPSPRKKPWVFEFINECSDFPNGTYDDRVDAMSQALFYMRENIISRPVVAMPVQVHHVSSWKGIGKNQKPVMGFYGH